MPVVLDSFRDFCLGELSNLVLKLLFKASDHLGVHDWGKCWRGEVELQAGLVQLEEWVLPHLCDRDPLSWVWLENPFQKVNSVGRESLWE